MVYSYDDSGRAPQTYGNNGPGAILNTTSFIGIVLGFFLIANRLYWRWNKGTPGIDDIIIVFAWIALVVLGIVTYIAVDYGYGRNSITLTRQEASDATRMFYLYQIFYKLTLNLSKLSILTLYLRVFDTRDLFGKITKCLIFLVMTFTVSIIIANIFICDPISTYWNTSPPGDPSRNNSSCISVLGYWYASSLYNILSETVMLLSVLVRIWTLPSHSQPPILQFRQKINLTAVLGLGVFGIVTSILRVTTLNQAAVATDKTGGTRVSTIWSSVEASLALVIANLPMLRQLLRWRGWCGGRWFSSTADKSRGHSHSRQRSEYTPANKSTSQNAIRPNSEPPVIQREDISLPGIHMQTDFRREVVKSEAGSDTAFSDVETQSSRRIELDSQSPSMQCHLTSKSLSGTFISSTELKWSGSNTPSIASTLRSPPIEPLPMIRISTEPSTASSSLHSVRTGVGVRPLPATACHIQPHRVE